MEHLTKPANPEGWPENWPQQYELKACSLDPEWCEEWKDQHECKCDAVGDCVDLLGAYESTELTPEQITEMKKDNDRLQQWVNDLQSGMYVNCVYCGHRYGPKGKTPVSMADVLKQHIEQCPKHPMSALKAELAKLQGDIDIGLLIRLPYAPGTVFHQDLIGEYDVIFTGKVAYEIVSGEETEYLGAEDLAEMVEECRKSLEEETPPKAQRRCRICGCTDDHACPSGCWWVAKDLCSACVGKEEAALPAHDTDGLKIKYQVFKVENGELVKGCFVLRPDRDPAAYAALERYAEKTINGALSKDIRKWLEAIGQIDTSSGAAAPPSPRGEGLGEGTL